VTALPVWLREGAAVWYGTSYYRVARLVDDGGADLQVTRPRAFHFAFRLSPAQIQRALARGDLRPRVKP